MGMGGLRLFSYLYIRLITVDDLLHLTQNIRISGDF